MKSRLFFIYLNEAAKYQLHKEYVQYSVSIFPHQKKETIQNKFKGFEQLLKDDESIKKKVKDDSYLLKFGLKGFKHKEIIHGSSSR